MTTELHQVLVTCDGLDGTVGALADLRERTESGALRAVYFSSEQADRVEQAFPDLCRFDIKRSGYVLHEGTGDEYLVLPEYVIPHGTRVGTWRWRFPAEAFRPFDLVDAGEQIQF
jgi:hypothetical protein